MDVVLIYKYGKRFRFAPSFNHRILIIILCDFRKALFPLHYKRTLWISHNLQMKQRNMRRILIIMVSDKSVVLRSLKFSWNEPFVPSVWPLDKFQCCPLWHRVYGHPNWADVLAVNRIIGLIVMPRRWNFGRWLLYQHMLMVKHTAQGDKKNGILFECVCQFPRLDTFRVLSFPKENLKSKIIQGNFWILWNDAATGTVSKSIISPFFLDWFSFQNIIMGHNLNNNFFIITL